MPSADISFDDIAAGYGLIANASDPLAWLIAGDHSALTSGTRDYGLRQNDHDIACRALQVEDVSSKSGLRRLKAADSMRE